MYLIQNDLSLRMLENISMQMFYASMFHPHYPGRALIGRLPFLHIRCNKRPVTMSLTSPSEESSEPARSADRSGAGPLTGSSNTGGENRPPGRRFTEEELTIHNLHRQACQVKSSTLRNFLRSDYPWMITDRSVDCSFD